MSPGPQPRIAIVAPDGTTEPVTWGEPLVDAIIRLLGDHGHRVVGATLTAERPRTLEISVRPGTADGTPILGRPTTERSHYAADDGIRTRVGAYAVCTGPEGLLLTQLRDDTPDGGRWTLPGGGIDADEQPDDAVIREVYEETGLTPTDARWVAIDDEVLGPWRHITAVHAVRILYRCAASGSPTVIKTDDTTVDARWFPLDALPIGAISGVRRALALCDDLEVSYR